MPFQCFNSDGQCGTTYWCGFTTTTTKLALISTSSTTSHAQSTTTMLQTTPPPSLPYATLLTFTLSADVSLANLTRHIACQPECFVRVLSVTRGNVTTYFARRLLAAETVTVHVGIVSPQQPTVSSSLGTVLVSQSFRVTNASVLDDPAQFIVFVQQSAAPLDSAEYIILYTAAAAHGAAMVLLAACCCVGKKSRVGGRLNSSMFLGVRITK